MGHLNPIWSGKILEKFSLKALLIIDREDLATFLKQKV